MLDIRNKNILKNILSFLKPKKYLSLIKYNKEIQKKLCKSIIDYREYNQIEIEIIPIKDDFSGKVINLINENNEYFHIYFDSKRKKTNYISSKDNVSKIKIIIDFEIKSFKGLFEDCEYISSIYFIKFNRKDITDMSHMFKGCINLINIDFSNFNTSKVKYMDSMFKNCSSLKELNLSNFNTSKVKYMNYMFDNCLSLKNLDISNFDIKITIGTDYMFSNCSYDLKNEIQKQNKILSKHAFNDQHEYELFGLYLEEDYNYNDRMLEKEKLFDDFYDFSPLHSDDKDN